MPLFFLSSRIQKFSQAWKRLGKKIKNLGLVWVTEVQEGIAKMVANRLQVPHREVSSSPAPFE